MTDDDTTPTAAQLTRRDTLRSGGALASLLGGGVTHDLAGGPESDAMSEHRVPLYRVPEPDLDSPGVVGRRVEITAGGSTYAAGDQLVDTGSSWERISPGYDSLNTEQVHTESRGPSVAVHIKDDGTIVADGPDGQLASGDSATQSDVTTVIQAALDNGGHVKVKPSTYTLGVSGQDGEGVDYCLSATDYTTLELEAGATLEYPADDSVTPPDVATPLLVHNTSNFKVCGEGTIDAGYHAQPAQDEAINAMGIKVGIRDQSETSTDIVVEDITATGAFRHFIETIGAPDDGPERIRVEGVTFDDASGDDDVSISIGSRYATVRDCWSINKVRGGNQFWTAASFEAEDGARHVVFDSLYSINPANNGITIGKSHSPDPSCKDHHAVNCVVVGSGKTGIQVTPSGSGQVTESINIERCEVVDAGKQAVFVGGSEDHTLRGITIDVDIRGTGTHGINFATPGTIEDLTIPSTTSIRGVTDYPVRFGIPNSTSTIYKDFVIDGAKIVSQKNVIQLNGDSSNYEGTSYIRDCDLTMLNAGWAFFAADTNGIRAHVITRDNDVPADPMPVPPANPVISMEVVADGANWDPDSDGNGEKVIYDGSWQEIADMPNLV